MGVRRECVAVQRLPVHGVDHRSDEQESEFPRRGGLRHLRHEDDDRSGDVPHGAIGWPKSRARISLYEGGHMAYTNESALKKFTDDVRQLVSGR